MRVKNKMECIIKIKFESIKGVKVNDKLLNSVPLLFESTLKTSRLLCENIEKYFNDHKIKVKTNLELIK